LQPNITLNSNETEKRKKFAADEIKPTLFMIKEGEMLLREGERVTDVQLQKLNALKETQAKENVLKTSSGGFMLVFAVLMITFVLYINLQKQSPLKSNSNILFISSLLIAFFLIAKISYSLLQLIMRNAAFSVPEHAALFGIPIAAGAMTVCLFMGLDLAIAFSLVISLLSGALFKNRFDIFLYYLLSSTMAAFWIQECKERKVFIIAGLKLGVLNILLATVICLYITDYSGFKLLWSWGFAFVGGISAGIITSGLAPLIEMTFGFTTNITLLELANLDRPILRKLMLEAPGTYHHSVIVGSMVEAAATAIGANCLLAKVCGYYHDIGKINKPVYFIENQQNGLNKHNKLAPSMSSLILMSHVKDGVEIARENKLGQTIIDTIKEHHGTSLISFFYEKAKQLKGKDAVSIDDFRYPGPKPKTIEAGLVMLADVVEASARTLEDPTPARIQGHVQNSINKIFSDGQLDNCELTLKDLHNIAKSFIKILNGIYHHRIDYPEKTAAGNGKAVNGSIDKQQTKQIQDIVKKPPEEIQIPFKRLGLS
jgi:putative nucleotidyltransferase with HDIG domain